MVENEQWNVFEVELEGPRDGNPFLEVELKSVFKPLE